MKTRGAIKCDPLVVEQYWRPTELAEHLRMTASTVKRHFGSAPGVLRFEVNGRVSLRIPQSAVINFQKQIGAVAETPR